MIGRLRGLLVSRRGEVVCVEVGGVGYDVTMTPRGVSALPGVGEEVVVHTHTHVREDEMSLYGFGTEADRDLFRILLGAGGVGPKLAMSILGTMTHQEIVRSIVTEDADALTVVPGVGKRGAQKIVLELAPKLAGIDAEVVGSTSLVTVRQALEGLGYSTEEINGVMGELDPDSAIETQIKAAYVRAGQGLAMREDSLLNPTIETDEEITLRPKRLDEFIGQDRVRERLEISLDAARKEKRPLDHVLLSGPPGLGKTTLAGVIANELDVKMRVTSGPALDRPGDLAAILSNLDTGDVFFIDEIHRLPRAVEEVLYPAMEDFQLDIVLGKGPTAQSIRLDLPQFTLVGATTRKGTVTAPLRDRFGIEEKLDYYSPDELAVIIRRSAGIIGVEISEDAAGIISHRSRSTPRIANRLLARLRDYAVSRASGVIDPDVANEALRVFEVDDLGLDKVDRAILESIVEKFGGGPVGLSTLAIAVGEEPETVEDAYEPFLLQSGLIKRTPRGRMATARAYTHLGQEPPADPQGRLI